MKTISSLMLLLGLTLSAAAQQSTGIYLSGDMNGWAQADPDWEFLSEPGVPGWASIDLSGMPADTKFHIVGHGRDFAMKNTRNTIGRNSMHLMTLDGTYDLTAGPDGLDGVHLLLGYEDFMTSKYIGIITRTEDTKVIYGACMASSVTPTLLPESATPGEYTAEVEISEPWFLVQALQVSNATQTICNYGLGSQPLTVTPTSNLAPTAEPLPVPDQGIGTYTVTFQPEALAYSVAGTQGLMPATTLPPPVLYYDLQGRPLPSPPPGTPCLKIQAGKTTKVLTND